MTDDASTFKSALSCAGDMARGLQSTFNLQARNFTLLLFDYMNSSSIDRVLKLNIINCIGDMMMNLQNSGQMYIDQFISLCDLCFAAVYNLQNQQS